MKNSQPILLAIITVYLTLLACAAQANSYRSAIPANQAVGAVGFHERSAMSKADTALSIAFDEYRKHTTPGKRSREQPFKSSNPFLRLVDGRVAIDARAAVSGAVLEADLRRLGLLNSQRYGEVVSGMLPVARIDRAAALSSLRSISASRPPVRNMASVTSQGDIALRADVARSDYAVDGTGIAIGVVSDSFDMLGGAAADIASGDLPAAGVTVIGGESPLCGLLIFCIDEGRAILQIAHDMAPGADLLFHSGLDGIATYANAITTLAAAGADVIVDDLLFLNEPMFQDGIVAQAVDTVAAAGVIYYSAAGNQRRQSYEAAFSDSGEIFCIEFFEPYDDCNEQFELVGTMHDFDPGPEEDLYQHVTIPIDATLTVAMQWDQPFGGPGAVTDHDIVLLDETGGTYFTISANDNVMTGEGWEALQFINSAELGHGTEFSIIMTYDEIDSSPDPPATLVKLVFFGEGIVIHDFPTDSSTLFGHANAAGAEAVGAAFFEDTPEYGTSPPLLEPFSSAGGTPIIFDTSGVALPSPELRLKPEITAVDGVNTTFFFDDSHGNDGVDDFFGTSAAAPHAAGIAALMLQAQPGATPAQVNAALESTAIDMGPAGFDHDSGYGLIQADLAIASLVQDIDLDGIDDIFDNCIGVPNGPNILDAGGNSQLDTNADGYGNVCDADLNNDGVVNGLDVGAFTAEFGTAGPDADFNGDGVVNGLDVGVFVNSFGTAPGPSGLAP
jgi:subtilisin family serine protease